MSHEVFIPFDDIIPTPVTVKFGIALNEHNPEFYAVDADV